MVSREIFTPKKHKKEKKEKWPRRTEHRRTAVEDDEAAPEPAECKLCREREQEPPARDRHTARGTRLKPLEERNADEADRRVGGKYRLRLPEVNAFKEDTVYDEARDHRECREMPLIFLNSEKDLSQHTGAWTRARTGDPFLFREVLYQLSYPSLSH